MSLRPRRPRTASVSPARRALALAVVLLVGPLLDGGRALAGPTMITTRPGLEADGDGLVFFVGGVAESGRSLKASSLELIVDGVPSVEPVSAQSFSDWATAAGEASASWRPPMIVGLVYLWIHGVPAGVLDGVHAFFQRLSPRTPVHPTIYGRLRQGRARLAAADIGRLDELPYLDGDRPNLLEAVRLDLADLAADPAPLKILLVVTDGRDFADPRGEGPGNFATLGKAIRRAGVTPFIVAFPAPEADAAQASANLRDLHAAAGGFLRIIDQVQIEELENTIESLGQGLADLQRVRVPTPWSWRLFGDAHRLAVRLTTGGGERLMAEVGTVSTGPGNLRGIIIGILFGLIVAIAGVLLFLRRRQGQQATASDDDQVLVAIHDLVRRGVSPQRAAEELASNHPEALGLLSGMNESLFADPRFPYLRTRPGRVRLKEIRDILSKQASARPTLGETLAQALAEAIEHGTPPDEAAKMLRGRTTANERAAFVALDFEMLAQALRSSADEHPPLRAPRARGIAAAIQDALRSDGAEAGGGGEAVLGWLVRAFGPGRRGETLRLVPARNVLGQAADCNIRLAIDPSVAPQHAEISLEAGEFAILPLGGTIKVEGKPVEHRQALVDGETLEIGTGLYVFKSATVGHVTASRPRISRPRRARS